MSDVDVPALFRLWADHGLTRPEIAQALGVHTCHLSKLAQRYGLGPRGHRWRPESRACEATPDEDAASGDSLALAPAVRRRIAELRIGFPIPAQPTDNK